MSQSPPNFTPEEVRQFRELDFQRRSGAQRDWHRNGVPINSRHEEWVKQSELQQQKEESFRSDASSNHYTTDGSSRTESAVSSEEFSPPAEEYSELSLRKLNPLQHHISLVSLGKKAASSPPKEVEALQTPRESALSLLGDNKRDVLMHSRKNGWKGLIATLDSGTEENWISSKVVDRLDLGVRSGLSKRYVTFDGHRISSTSTVEPTWCVQGQSRTHVAVFRVAAGDPPFDVLIGRNLLTSGDVDFDSEDSPIQILIPENMTKKEKEEQEWRRNVKEAVQAAVKGGQAQNVKPEQNGKSISKGDKSKSDDKK